LVNFVGLDPKLHALVFGQFNFVEQMQVVGGHIFQLALSSTYGQ
jgi:hypothetical protein